MEKLPPLPVKSIRIIEANPPASPPPELQAFQDRVRSGLSKCMSGSGEHLKDEV
jgi:hypothetical protein